ncbi:hypothetical protein BGZ80_010831 [Entomortierella chlamydospora]|uniref:Uncharacterized protein n=1 Tax=Entomortierella chlamydospora TaxID=101097 RepID=A0A9P6T5Q9_9FUNG|nr:hypothetical protein BGZ79_006921 [Entomortierella chlamydospora]KAG0024674.1 hypothetical protein BGZ80_010831 [Entomortierella chlamydospora]
MASQIAPPASFGLISGTAFASASPAALAKILDSLDLASLENEHARLERAIQQLEQSNKEIEEFIELEQQELAAHLQGDNPFQPDPEFMLAIDENKAVIAKYNKTCADLKSAIQRKRGTASQAEAGVSHEPSNEGGVYL